MIKVKADWILNITGYAGTTIAPFSFYNSEDLADLSEEDLAIHWNHERIHIRQQVELLFIGFYALYFYYYMEGRLNGLNHDDAYNDIPMELEAYDHEVNLKYLESRERNAWSVYR